MEAWLHDALQAVVSMRTETMVSLLLGLLVVLIFGSEKFNEPSFPKKDDDPATAILPQFLATRAQYSTAKHGYILLLAFVFLLLSALGPRIFEASGENVASLETAFPVWVALVMTGVLPNVPWIKQLELSVRRFFHERAYIPEGASGTANRLASADFDFTPYRNGAASDDESGNRFLSEIQPGDYDLPRTTIENKWARLSCILSKLKENEDLGTHSDHFDAAVLSFYRADLHSNEMLHRSMEKRMRDYRARDQREQTDPELRDDLTALLRRAYVLVACAVRARRSSENSIAKSLRALGFQIRPLPQEKIDWDIYLQWAAMSLAFVVFVILVSRRVFEGSPNLPPNWQQALVWALSAFLVHGSAAVVATRLRLYWIRHERWFKGGDEGDRAPMLRYLQLGIVAGIAGCLVNLICGFFTTPVSDMSWLWVKSILPWAILPAVTGAFIGFYFDLSGGSGSTVRRMAWRLGQSSLQGIATGIAGFIAAELWWPILREWIVTERIPAAIQASGLSGEQLADAVTRAVASAQLPLEDPVFSLWVATMTYFIGASIGFLLPHGYRKSMAVVEARYREDNVARVLTEADAVFDDAQQAEAWLDAPEPKLNGVTPREALASLGGIDKVLAVLSQRRPASTGLA